MKNFKFFWADFEKLSGGLLYQWGNRSSSSGSPRPFNHRRFDLFSDINEGKNSSKLFNNDNTYYYEIIYGGNSSEVIEECLKRRNQWKIYYRSGEELTQNFNSVNSPTNNNFNSSPTNSSVKFNNQAYMSFANLYNYSNQNENNPLPNFIWSHSSTRLDFGEFSKYRPTHIKKMTNHFEFHKEITNKMNLFLNMIIYCESFNLDLFSMVPLTFPIRYESQNYINEISSLRVFLLIFFFWWTMKKQKTFAKKLFKCIFLSFIKYSYIYFIIFSNDNFICRNY